MNLTTVMLVHPRLVMITYSFNLAATVSQAYLPNPLNPWHRTTCASCLQSHACASFQIRADVAFRLAVPLGASAESHQLRMCLLSSDRHSRSKFLIFIWSLEPCLQRLSLKSTVVITCSLVHLSQRSVATSINSSRRIH